MITIHNQGPLIAATDYWSSPLAARGLYYLTANSGALRLLVPAARSADIAEMRTAREIVVSYGAHSGAGPLPFPRRELAAEVLFDDRTLTPFVLWLDAEQWDRLPAAEDLLNGCEFTVWENRRGTPHKVLSRPCCLRRAALPCMQPRPNHEN